MGIRSGTTTTRGEAHARANDARDGAAVDPGAAPPARAPNPSPNPTRLFATRVRPSSSSVAIVRARLSSRGVYHGN